MKLAMNILTSQARISSYGNMKVVVNNQVDKFLLAQDSNSGDSTQMNAYLGVHVATPSDKGHLSMSILNEQGSRIWNYSGKPGQNDGGFSSIVWVNCGPAPTPQFWAYTISETKNFTAVFSISGSYVDQGSQNVSLLQEAIGVTLSGSGAFEIECPFSIVVLPE
jgi:hypothetical protein